MSSVLEGDRNDLYELSRREDQISEGFAYAAIAIWVSDMIWTIAASSKPDSGKEDKRMRGWSLQPEVDPRNGSALLVLRYNFNSSE
jgi:hypothetical protein